MALKSILNNKIRSLLTMLGIIIGVASVIAIVASIQGTTKLQKLQYEAMGANRIDVYAWGARNKDWQEFEEYLDSLDEVAAWSPQSQCWDWQNGGVQYRSQKMDSNGSDSGYLQMYFVNEHYGEVTSMSISAGRDLTEADCKSRARVCVIGETLRKYFFGAMSRSDRSFASAARASRSSASMQANTAASSTRMIRCSSCRTRCKA